MSARYRDFEHGITAIDAKYQRPGLAAIHLIEEAGEAALIDTGTSHSVPHVLEVLAKKGLAPEQVAYVILTHVHLDHAGGAGELMRRLPRARLVVHPRGARHMIDPAKLIAGAVAVYGAGEAARAYGQVRPVPAERVVEAHEGFTLDLNGRRLLFLDTAGHARHHCCIVDEASHAVFSGDTFGISYREFDVNGREFIFPATTPVQFDPAAAHASIDRLLAFNPQQMFLTHFSRVTQIRRLADDLHDMLEAFVRLAHSVRRSGENRHRLLVERLRDLFLERLEQHGCTLPAKQAAGLLAMDIELNAQGLEVWLDALDKAGLK